MSKIRLIIIKYIVMSSIIDDLIDLDFKQMENSRIMEEKQSLIYQLSKTLNNSYASLICQNDAQTIKTSIKIQHQDKDYVMQISSDRKLISLSASLQEVHQTLYKKVPSRNLDTSVINKLTSIQYQHQAQFILCLERSCLVMKMKMSYPIQFANRRAFIRLFNHILRKSTIQFHNILSSNFKNSKEMVEQSQKQTDLFSDIAVSLILNKTQSNFDYTSNRAAQKINVLNLNKQKKEVKKIQNSIITERDLQSNNSLFVYIQKGYTIWLRANLQSIWESHLRRYKNSLEIPGLEQRRIGQSANNIVKIQLKEPLKKLIAQGGSSLIFCAKFVLTYVNSQSRLSNSKEQLERVEKNLVVKTIKPEYQRVFREKLEHQRKIVHKIQTEGSSYFLPRYYPTQKQHQLSSSLLMDYINGEQLDSFLKSRSLTISFRTKMYLFLNIVFGMRFLVHSQIVHLDIKPINILVCKNLITKIIDFGEAYHKDICSKHYTPGFTFPYVAPQVYSKYELQLLHKRKDQMIFSEKQDAFALGMIMYEALFDCKLFNYNIPKYKEVYAAKKISERFFFTPQKLEDYEEYHLISALMHNIGKCLDCEPQNRPNIDWIGILFKIILTFLNNR